MELNVTISSTIAADFAFAGVLGTDGERDSAARRELCRHDHFARRACSYEVVENSVGHCFIERALIPIRSQIKLERLAFDTETVRHVIDIDPGEIRLAGDWTN